MNLLRLSLRTVWLGPPRARRAAILIAASLCALDLFAGHLEGERGRLEYRAVVGQRLGHLGLVPRDGNSVDPAQMARIGRLAQATPGVALAAPEPGRIAVFLSAPAELDQVRTALADALTQSGIPAEVRGWRQLSPGYAGAERTLRLEFSCAATLVLVLAWASLAVTMAIGARERRRELATLRALGMRRLGIFTMMSGEALWITVYATALSLTASGLIAWIANRAALYFGSPPLARPPMSVELDPAKVLAAAVAVLAAALLAASIPAFKVARADTARSLALCTRTGW